MVARMFANQLSTDYCVTPNAHMVGRISGRSRQVDVLIELRHDTDNSCRIIVDAKSRARKVDVKDVESFRGMMEDVGATHGYLVCPTGYTKAAERRAQAAVSIRLVPLDRLEGFDPSTWPACMNQRCKRGRVFWDGYPELSMTIKAVPGSRSGEITQIKFVHYVGKCDRCGRFHVRCVTCNVTLSPRDDDDSDIGYRCSCEPPWFWLASMEQDEDSHKSAELHAVLGTGKVITVDRRSV